MRDKRAEELEIKTERLGPLYSASTVVDGGIRIVFGGSEEEAVGKLISVLRRAAKKRPKRKKKPKKLKRKAKKKAKKKKKPKKKRLVALPEKPAAKLGAKELAKRIAEGDSKLAIDMLKRQRESDG